MMERLGLREVLLEKYHCCNKFSTYERGSTIIDGVFMSQGLQIDNGGYTSFDKSPSDHRWLWFDIKIHQVIGEAFVARARPLERKATSKVPSIKENFNRLLNKQVQYHKLDSKVEQLVTFITEQQKVDKEGISRWCQQQMDLFNDILVRLVNTADKQCQKARRGLVPSSPLLDQARHAIRILQLLI